MSVEIFGKLFSFFELFFPDLQHSDMAEKDWIYFISIVICVSHSVNSKMYEDYCLTQNQWKIKHEM